MTAKGAAALRQTASALVERWPVDASRKGRDLGEFLRQHFTKKVETLASGSSDQVRGRACAKFALSSQGIHPSMPCIAGMESKPAAKKLGSPQ